MICKVPTVHMHIPAEAVAKTRDLALSASRSILTTLDTNGAMAD